MSYEIALVEATEDQPHAFIVWDTVLDSPVGDMCVTYAEAVEWLGELELDAFVAMAEAATEDAMEAAGAC